MTDQEVEFLLKYCNKSTDLLEYGSGGSTLLLQNHVSSLVSVEHDPIWYNKILENKLKDNVDYYLVEPNNKNWELQFNKDQTKNTKGDDGSFEDFFLYCIFPTSLSRLYNTVLIDGRARLACSYVASNLLKDDGVILIHDFGQKCYHKILEYRTYYDPVKELFDVVDNEETLYCLRPKI